MLDSDLARIYGVTTKNLNKAVKRNSERFPADFMFQLSTTEVENLRFQTGTSSGYGGRRYLPYVFTEHGAWMLGNILSSPIAIEASIEVVRSFIRLREMIISHSELSKKLTELEKNMILNLKSCFRLLNNLWFSRKNPLRRLEFKHQV